MLDVRKPIGLLFMILGALLFVYGMIWSQPVEFYTPNAHFPLKLNQPVGAFMFAFGLVMWQLARYVRLDVMDKELEKRETELEEPKTTQATQTPGETNGGDEKPKEDK